MEFLNQLKIQSINPGVSTGVNSLAAGGEKIESFSPVDGKLIGVVQAANRSNYDAVIKKAEEAFAIWRTWPAPKRGEVVRQVGEALRKCKEPLGQLVSY